MTNASGFLPARAAEPLCNAIRLRLAGAKVVAPTLGHRDREEKGRGRAHRERGTSEGFRSTFRAKARPVESGSVTEFGRTARNNGSDGTDHGTGGMPR
jgi:hypothetical protein